MKIMSKFFTALFALAIVFTIGGVVSASTSTLDLTTEEKEAYHKQYVEIVEELNAQEGTNYLEVVPLEDFADEDWIAPEDFKQLAIERANLTFTESESTTGEIGTFAVSKTKTKSFNSNGATASIDITGSFNTYYSDAHNRQMFGSINYIVSDETSSDNGSWSQTGYSPSLIDGGRTYATYVGGKYTLNGLTSSHNVYVEFYCSSVGGVS